MSGQKKGTVTIGIQGGNSPWGFVNTSGTQDGFDADIGRLFATELGVKTEFVPLAVVNRIPALTTGRVDVLFATMAMTAERAKAVQYSKPYVAIIIYLVSAKAANRKCRISTFQRFYQVTSMQIAGAFTCYYVEFQF